MTDQVKDHYIDVGGETTYVTKCGSQPKDALIIIIPGNPGSAAYYDEFAEVLYENSDKSVPVWCVSHAGHITIPNEHKNGSSKDEFYSLQGQIEHKLQFVKEHVPPDVKLILIGHSIGCYIILHMMDDIGDRVLKCSLLFLTIERMAVAPKGRWMTPFLKYMRWAAPIVIYPISWLPEWVHTWILNLYFRNRPVHQGSIKATKQLVSSQSFRNFTNMANEEFQKVVVADYHLIEQYMDKLWFYYGSCDHWCPVEYHDDMKKQFPEADITLCKHGFEHAFCLESSKEMAHIVWEYLTEKLPNFIGS